MLRSFAYNLLRIYCLWCPMGGCAVVCVFVEKGRELLLLEKPDTKGGLYWSLPEGAITSGESPKGAAVRVLKDEMGLTVDSSTALEEITIGQASSSNGVSAVHVFLCTCDQQLDLQLPRGHRPWAWVSWLRWGTRKIQSPLKNWMLRYMSYVLKGSCLRREFYYMRHGQTDQNVGGRFASGDSDIPLNARGRQQAMQMRDLVTSLPIRRICHSPMKRVLETVDLAARGTSVERLCLPDLQERSKRAGAVEGFLDRVYRAINCCLSEEGIPLLVAHGDVFQALCHVLHLPQEYGYLQNCQVVHIAPQGTEEWRIQSL